MNGQHSSTAAVVIFCALVALVFGLMGSACGRSRRRGWAGFWLGFLLGPLGCGVALFLPANARRRSWR